MYKFVINSVKQMLDCADTDWDSKLQQTMVEIFPLRSADAAYSKISGMLATLGDPFTRIISPKVCCCCPRANTILAWLALGCLGE